MDKRDARTLSQDAQHEVRRQSIKLHLKGYGRTKIAEEVDVHRNTVSKWIKRYEEGGMKALAVRKRGAELG
ncbi:MAG: helix-turn-helix domain-containing protein, partial [Akkermansiaceae bacterium]|nr:helix-turn-helix domain-containing protein [Akkermansiaceae bacterium]